jgi:hypothetical protein
MGPHSAHIEALALPCFLLVEPSGERRAQPILTGVDHSFFIDGKNPLLVHQLTASATFQSSVTGGTIATLNAACKRHLLFLAFSSQERKPRTPGYSRSQISRLRNSLRLLVNAAEAFRPNNARKDPLSVIATPAADSPRKCPVVRIRRGKRDYRKSGTAFRRLQTPCPDSLGMRHSSAI